MPVEVEATVDDAHAGIFKKMRTAETAAMEISTTNQEENNCCCGCGRDAAASKHICSLSGKNCVEKNKTFKQGFREKVFIFFFVN